MSYSENLPDIDAMSTQEQRELFDRIFPPEGTIMDQAAEEWDRLLPEEQAWLGAILSGPQSS